MPRHPTYIPRNGSLADKVLRFLRENPEEELTRSDVSVKFGVMVSSVGGCLFHTVHQNHLVQTRNDKGQLVYRLPDLFTNTHTNAIEHATA